MKRLFGTMFICLISVCAFAQAPAFTFVTEFLTHPDYGSALAIAVDNDGGLYFTQFSDPDPNMTACLYLADPINANELENMMLVTDALEGNTPSGRGLHGLAVDNEGYVYLALESGDTATATVRKLTPAPDFEIDPNWGDVILGGKRYNGIELLSEDVMALTTFTDVDFWNPNDPFAPLLHSVTGGETYQRDLAYNPDTGDIYIAKNRDVDGAPHSSCSILRGDGPDNLASYTEIEPNFIPQGGVGGTYGAHAQKIDYDVVNDLIIIPDYSTDPPTMAFYDPTDTSAPVAAIDGSDSETGEFENPTDAVAYTNADDETFIFITTWDEDRIVVYQMGEATEVYGWDLF